MLRLAAPQPAAPVGRAFRRGLAGLVLLAAGGVACAGDPPSSSALGPPSTGSLRVTVEGLPAGVSAAIAVSGGPGYQRMLDATATLTGLTPGSYTITAENLTDQGQLYLASPATQTAAVSAGGTIPASVRYAVAGEGLDFRIDGVYFTQAIQRYDGQVPLVAGRDAYLRVFALADRTNSAQPKVRVRLFGGGALVATYTINPSTSAVPTEPDESQLQLSWNVAVPGSLVQPGLRVLADVDPANAVAEGNEANNQFPLSGVAAELNVQSLPVLGLRFVPVLQQVNGLQGQVTAANQETFLGDVKKLLPVGAYDADLRQPYTTTAPPLQHHNANGAWNTLLSELLALRSAEASGRYYYGVVKVTYGSGVAGMGYLGGGAQTALGWDYLPSGVGVMAHELGHNLGRQHAPCGGVANLDAGYPHPSGQIGAWGLDLESLQLKQPTLADLMSYCGPSWVSDYNWSAMVSYRLGGPNGATEGGAGSGLLVWGRVTPGAVVLEPAFRVPAAPGLAPHGGSQRLELLAGDGTVLRGFGFEATAVADLPGSAERHFAVVVPLDAQLESALAGLRVVAAGRSAARVAAPPGDPTLQLARVNDGQVEARWDAARFPVVMVRDAATGQVLSFARGGRARWFAAGQDFELQFSDGVRGVTRQARVLR